MRSHDPADSPSAPPVDARPLDEFATEDAPEPERLVSAPLINIAPAEVAGDRELEPLSRNEATEARRRNRRRSPRRRLAIPTAALREGVKEVCSTSSQRTSSAVRESRRASRRLVVRMRRRAIASRARMAAERESIENRMTRLFVALDGALAELDHRSAGVALYLKEHTATLMRHAQSGVRSFTLLTWLRSVDAARRVARLSSRAFARPVTESPVEHLEFNGFVVSVALTVAVVGYGGLLTGFWRSPSDARVPRVAAPVQANEPQALAAVAVPEPVPEPVTVDGPLAEASVVTRPAVVPVVATSAAPAAFTPTARALTALWQRRDTRSLDRAFATLRRETLAFRSCALRVTENDRAVARCQGDVSWTIDFQRSRGSWSIAHVTTR